MQFSDRRTAIKAKLMCLYSRIVKGDDNYVSIASYESLLITHHLFLSAKRDDEKTSLGYSLDYESIELREERRTSFSTEFSGTASSIRDLDSVNRKRRVKTLDRKAVPIPPRHTY